jgi:hypothetical protein
MTNMSDKWPVIHNMRDLADALVWSMGSTHFAKSSNSWFYLFAFLHKLGISCDKR